MRTLQSELIDKGLHSKEKSVAIPAKRQKKEEKLTAAQLRELMGMNRDTFKRVGGAIRKR